jgi:hypothetical protein
MHWETKRARSSPRPFVYFSGQVYFRFHSAPSRKEVQSLVSKIMK